MRLSGMEYGEHLPLHVNDVGADVYGQMVLTFPFI